MAMRSAARPLLRGVVFDMDGTLTKPNLDFGEMYRRCGVPRSEDILEAVRRMPPAEAEKAKAVIDDMEVEGRRTMELFPGAADCCRWLQAHGIPTALVTRNTAASVAHFHAALWEPAGLRPFGPVICRDSGLPPKPKPAALHAIAEAWDLRCDESLLMVGDSVAYDIAFGREAGVATALVDSSQRHSAEGAHGATFCVDNLALLPRQLWQHYDVEAASDVLAGSAKHEKPTPTTAAGAAASSGDVDTLMALPLAEVMSADASGNTPLIWAADAGSTAAVKALQARYAAAEVDVADALNMRGFLGATAVSRASRYGHTEVLELLLRTPGVDCDISNEKMQYPLHFAAFKKMPAAVELLLRAGASCLVLDRKGRTPAEDTSDEAIRQRLLGARSAQAAVPDVHEP